MSTTTRRTFVSAAAALSATIAFPALTFAQDAASPEASAGADSSLLTELGLPEVAVTFTDDGIDVPAELTAGTVLLTATNSSSAYASSLFVQLADGVTDADVQAALGVEGLPEWLHSSVVTGSVEIEPGQVAQVAFVLTPGDWYVVNAGDIPGIVPVTVTGELVETPIEAGVEVIIDHHRFEIPATVPAGPQIWQVTNEEAVLHHMILFTYPEAIDEDQFLELLMASEGGATPAAGGLDPAQMGFAGGTGLISQGQTNWIEYDLAPGNYQATCFISDPGSELPHAAGGMVAVFTVA